MFAPSRYVCLSNTRVRDIRKHVFEIIKCNFQNLEEQHIQLAYRTEVDMPPELKEQEEIVDSMIAKGVSIDKASIFPTFYKYHVIQDIEMTLGKMVDDKGWWKKERVNLAYKEQCGIPGD